MSTDLTPQKGPKLQLAEKGPSRVPSLKVLGRDPEVREFFKIIYDYNLREKALILLSNAIAKAN